MGEVFLGDLDNVDFNRLICDLKSSSKNVGCILLFIGSVREESFRGGSVKFLHYEAYEDLALKVMRKIVEDAEAFNDVFSATILHSLGDRKVGSNTFIVGVAAKHRIIGFKVLRRIVERVKGEVPIWKKEITDSGEYWIH
ncbi:MAG: molybdenum cofactor biosynthesis protein MoaE [Candidatus Methanomethylicota archaeon]|nr:MAG: molybdenum cofactor biosynthesis protein MoaE [Candidatus Verstraetearchaeota archaeon]